MTGLTAYADIRRRPFGPHLDDMVVVQPKDADEAGDYRVMPYREFLSRADDFHLCPDVRPEDLE